MLLVLSFVLIFFSELSYANNVDYFYLFCDVRVVKDFEPVASCEKITSSSKTARGQSQLAHDKWLIEIQKKNPNLICFRDTNKDRSYYQYFTVCHTKDKLYYRILTSNVPRDYRAVLFMNGLEVRWHETKVAYFVHNKFLLPDAGYRAWLLPEKTQ